MKTTKYLKVSQHYNKNQFVIKDNEREKIYFQSYDSLIAIYNQKTKKLTIGKYWDYSNTTRKHLYLFIDDYCNIKIDYLYNIKNKRQYILKCIKNKLIKLDKNME